MNSIINNAFGNTPKYMDKYDNDGKSYSTICDIHNLKILLSNNITSLSVSYCNILPYTNTFFLSNEINNC